MESNIGITAGQIKALLEVIEKTVGKERGETARTVILQWKSKNY